MVEMLHHGEPIQRDPEIESRNDATSDTKALTDDTKSTDEEVFEYEDSRKLGITSSVFLILNKMIGTGSGAPHIHGLLRG